MRGLCIAANRIFAMMSIYNVVYICGSRICVSTPYMTGEYGIHWMTFAPRTRVHIFMIIYVMHFVAYDMYPVNFHQVDRNKNIAYIKTKVDQVKLKRIVSYLKGTSDLGRRFGSGPNGEVALQ